MEAVRIHEHYYNYEFENCDALCVCNLRVQAVSYDLGLNKHLHSKGVNLTWNNAYEDK